ncbi:unnamed protein product [Clonostachys rosea]|uniref:Uncharacterized protein n=1 Tax=Bionectria ochroleuca TaxID=29856 RepID=A0ABY6V2Y3_BIOOC|nr:unnamed protein product [Clonostachys rosea]
MYYYNQNFFFHLSFIGITFEDRKRLTRVGVCIAATGGRCGIADYIESQSQGDTSETKDFLELIYMEQFFISGQFQDRKFRASNARALLEYGVQISQKCRDEYGDHSNWTDDELFLFEYLIRDTRTLSAETIEYMVEAEGTRVLELLSLHGYDLSQYGASALASAARKLNQEAVKWLLEEGVNLNSEVQVGTLTLTVLGAVMWQYETGELQASNIGKKHTGLSMMRYLVQAGAGLKRHPTDHSPRYLLETLSYWDDDEEVYEAFEYLSSIHTEMAKISTEEWVSILNMLISDVSHEFPNRHTNCLRCQLFMDLLQEHCESQCERLLAPAIYADVRQDIIEYLIARTVDIDRVAEVEYEGIELTPLQAAAGRCNKLLVSQLLSLGADVNTPGQGYLGRTALQAICKWDPIDKEEHEQKSALIRFLLMKGAKANDGADTAAAQYAALQYCVMGGDLEHVALLLEHGADPNMPCLFGREPIRKQFSTLGLAVKYDRLDIVHLLLGMGALSSLPCQTGYDGAIMYAQKKSRISIVNLIQKHVDKQEVLFRQQPQLGVEHEARIQRHVTRMEQYRTSCARDDRVILYEGQRRKSR